MTTPVMDGIRLTKEDEKKLKTFVDALEAVLSDVYTVKQINWAIGNKLGHDSWELTFKKPVYEKVVLP